MSYSLMPLVTMSDAPPFRTAWITGGSTGIGRALVLELVRRGCHVAVSGRAIESLQSLEAEAQGLPGKVISLPLDVADRDATLRVGEEAVRLLGDLDLMVACAGTHVPMKADNFSSSPFRKLLDTNVMGTVHALEAVIPRFVARKRGHVVVVSSVAGYRGLPTASAYGASKAALINMSEALHIELKRHGVKLQLVDPGFVRTPLTDKNTFPMPFLMPVEKAGRQFYEGLLTSRFEITFPKRFTWIMKLMRLLPYALYLPLTERATRGQK